MHLGFEMSIGIILTPNVALQGKVRNTANITKS